MSNRASFAKDFATAWAFHAQHKKDLRSKNKITRARAQRMERTSRRLDAEIAQALGSFPTLRTSR
jgi:hypothetical protein